MEFVVNNINNIKWNPLSFQNFAIPENWKKLIWALAVSHIKKVQFDNFVPGKGHGLIMLLQYKLHSAFSLEKTNAEH